MALVLGAANAPSLNGFFGPLLEPRVPVAVGRYPIIKARNDSSPGPNTVNMFIDSTGDDFEYAASIISVCIDTTVFAIQCTNTPVGVGPATCGPNGAVATLTAGPSTYELSSAVSTQTLGVGVIVTILESCVLARNTAATCTATVEATADGTKTSTQSVTTLSGSDYFRFDVAITGGGDKLANPTACAKSGATPNLNAKNMAMWALAGVVGVAGVLSM